MMKRTYTHTHVWVHAWASTTVVGRDEHPDQKGMPRDGDPCSVPGCAVALIAGEEAVACIEVNEPAVESWGQTAWCGYDHPTHKTWHDGVDDS